MITAQRHSKPHLQPHQPHIKRLCLRQPYEAHRRCQGPRAAVLTVLFSVHSTLPPGRLSPSSGPRETHSQKTSTSPDSPRYWSSHPYHIIGPLPFQFIKLLSLRFKPTLQYSAAVCTRKQPERSVLSH